MTSNFERVCSLLRTYVYEHHIQTYRSVIRSTIYYKYIRCFSCGSSVYDCILSDSGCNADSICSILGILSEHDQKMYNIIFLYKQPNAV